MYSLTFCSLMVSRSPIVPKSVIYSQYAKNQAMTQPSQIFTDTLFPQ